MTDSILNSTKKILGIAPEDTAFDPDIVTHINTAFFTLSQIGIGPAGGHMILDENDTWDAFLGTDLALNSVKTLIFFKVRLAFDPPQVSFHLNALQEQAKELEWRLSVHRETTGWTDPNPPAAVTEEVWAE